jgi:hypothetical protein
MQRAVDAGANSLTQRLAGAFTPTGDLQQLGQYAFELTQRMLAV